MTWAVGILHIPRMPGCPCAREHRSATRRVRIRPRCMYASVRVRATRIQTMRPRHEYAGTRMDDVAYSPICLVASGEKTKWLSGAGFSPYAHAFSPRRPNRVPNVEQRRHTNPHGYPGQTRRGVILSFAFRRFLSAVPLLFPARLLLSAVHNVD